MNKFLLPLLPLFFLVPRLSAQCVPQVLNCNTAVQACDFSSNNPQFWNELYWWDQGIQTHDLAEAAIDLSLAVQDTCPGSVLSVRCLLYLDLDGDGVQESLLDSDSLPASPNTVFFHNIGSGGSVRSFDERPVSGDQKWRFALKTAVSGDTSVFSLHWATLAAPNVYELPELPYGTHKVRWIVTNNAGFVKTCEKSFTIKDCKAPTVVCLNGLSVNIMPTQLITLWASDFLQYAEDNVTPTGQIVIGIRKPGTGTGFPLDTNGNPITSVTFNCDELGAQAVELWAMDAAGNADYCETYILVQDNLGNCIGPPTLFQVCAQTACGEGVEEASFILSGSPFVPPFWLGLSDAQGCLSTPNNIPVAQGMILSAEKVNDPLWGVSTFDLLTIQKHIDGVDPFDTPYQWVAADANEDLVIDTLDVLECKKLLLGISDGPGWRFVDRSYVFPSPDPLSVPYPDTILVDLNNPMFEPEFVAIKLCDLSCGNIVGFYDKIPENQHLIGTPTPNPASEEAVVPLQLLAADKVILEVLDVSGRVLLRNELSLPAGAALLEIPASAMPRAGVYVWRVRAGDVVESGKLMRY